MTRGRIARRAPHRMALGPLVKGMGFAALMWIMAGIAAIKAVIVLLLPDEPRVEK